MEGSQIGAAASRTWECQPNAWRQQVEQMEQMERSLAALLLSSAAVEAAASAADGKLDGPPLKSHRRRGDLLESHPLSMASLRRGACKRPVFATADAAAQIAAPPVESRRELSWEV